MLIVGTRLARSLSYRQLQLHLKTSPWQHPCGNIPVETSLWKYIRDNISVVKFQCNHLRTTTRQHSCVNSYMRYGNIRLIIQMIIFLWQHFFDKIAMAISAWQRSRSSILLRGNMPMSIWQHLNACNLSLFTFPESITTFTRVLGASFLRIVCEDRRILKEICETLNHCLLSCPIGLRISQEIKNIGSVDVTVRFLGDRWTPL